MKAVEVNNQTFYHTSVTLDGQGFFDSNPTVLIDPKVNNPRYNDLVNLNPSRNTQQGELGWLRYLDYLIETNKNSPQMINVGGLLENVANISTRLNNRYYERIFEEIRAAEFPNLPSRYSCIYLADIENVKIWYKKALEQLNIKELPIYEFKACGKVHYADAEWLEVDVVPDEEFKKVARRYWNGERHPDSTEDLKEILFEGNLLLVKKHTNLQDLLATF